MTTALQSLVDRGLFLSVEHQRAFEEHLLPDAAQVDFAGPGIVLPGIDATATPYLLGSSSPTRGTWIWSWQEPGHFLPAVLAAAESARRYGVDHDVPELAGDEIPLEEGLDERLVVAAKTATGVHAHYTAGAGGGARVWMLVRSDALVLEPPTVRTVGRTIAEGLHTGLASDHRAAVEGYARRRGLHLSADADDRVVLSTTDGGVELTFDGSAIKGIDLVESRRPAGYEPEPVPVSLVEPQPARVEPVEAEPTRPTTRVEPVEAEPTPVEPVPEEAVTPSREPEPAAGSVPERHQSAPPAAAAQDARPEGRPESEPEPERTPEPEPAPEPAEKPAEEAPRKRGFLDRLLGR